MSDHPLAELKTDPETARAVATTFYFRPNPSVRRVITLGTPHRGSPFANDLTRWAGNKLISLPKMMVEGRNQLLSQNKHFFRANAPIDINTSIDSLAPDSPLLGPLLAASPGPWVTYHNVVGREAKPGFLSRYIVGDGDGVVALSSARLDNVPHVESQIVVSADHSNVHRHPQSVLEVRRVLFEQTAGMFPELVTRPDLQVFLPPIGGMTLYFFGDVHALGNPATRVACRVHDECNGSDVFGSDICTCRPYLAHGVEVCIEMAQQGGVGLVIYNRKEGRALGEVTKFLVYNARKRQAGGDRAATYFERTECVAGVQDMRFQELMPDVFHWLGIERIDRWASMSNMKSDALAAQGIAIGEQVAIPDGLIPADARVEMDAKKAAGYYAPEPTQPCNGEVAKGRALDE